MLGKDIGLVDSARNRCPLRRWCNVLRVRQCDSGYWTAIKNGRLYVRTTRRYSPQKCLRSHSYNSTLLQARTLITAVLKVFLVRLPESDAISCRQKHRS